MSANDEFCVVSAAAIDELLERDRQHLVPIVRETYRSFGQGRAVNPHSSFLRFNPKRIDPANRIIALPAFVEGDPDLAGIKWIASFPKNPALGRPRASATLVLNSATTGRPFACMEGSLISAARTAASAVLGANLICSGIRDGLRIGFVGTGLIARDILKSFVAEGWRFAGVQLFDAVEAHGRRFAEFATPLLDQRLTVARSLDEVLGNSDLLVFATTASRPYVVDPEQLSPSTRILNISLRDLGPDVILRAENVVDDIEHCLREQTSPHLAELQIGSRNFDLRNIHDCFDADGGFTWKPSGRKPVVFSPFGLGVLDIAVGALVFREARKAGRLVRIDEFFPAGAWV
jgi:ornithine cyclodeaminase